MASAQPRLRVGDIEIPSAVLRTRGVDKASVAAPSAATPAPADNPLYKAVFAEGLAPEERRAQIAAIMRVTASKVKNKEAAAAYVQMQEWLESEFQRMQREILRLTDTETFSVMQGVYQDMLGSLDQFDRTMKPLTDTLDALYALNTEGKTFDAYLEIQHDDKARAEFDTKRADQRRQYDDIEQGISALRDSVLTLGEDKSWFGFGNVKKRSREEIALKSAAMADAQGRLSALQTQIAELGNSPNTESALGELAVHKAELRKLLNISSDDWKKQQQSLVSSALAFIDNTKTRIGDVEKHLGRMTEQVDALYDTNSKMGQVYAIVGDGMRDAEGLSKTDRQTWEAAPENETMIEKLSRTDKLSIIDEHAKTLSEAVTSCTTGFAGTTSEEVRLRTMRESNRDKIAKARAMATQGTSSMAGKVAVVVNAVSDAALGESESALRDMMGKMSDRTNAIAQKQVIAQSLNAQQLSKDLEKTLADIGSMREVVQAGRGIMEAGVAAVRDTVASMQELAEGLRTDSGEAGAVYSKHGEDK